MMSKRDSLWCLVLNSRYRDSIDTPCKRVSNLNSTWWRDLVKVCGKRREGSWFGKHHLEVRR